MLPHHLQLPVTTTHHPPLALRATSRGVDHGWNKDDDRLPRQWITGSGRGTEGGTMGTEANGEA